MSNWFDNTGVDQAHPPLSPLVATGSELWVCVSVSRWGDWMIVPSKTLMIAVNMDVY